MMEAYLLCLAKRHDGSVLALLGEAPYAMVKKRCFVEEGTGSVSTVHTPSALEVLGACRLLLNVLGACRLVSPCFRKLWHGLCRRMFDHVLRVDCARTAL